MTTTIYKQLASLQDLAFGEGEVTQSRNGKNITVDKIAFDIVFSTVAKMKASVPLIPGMTVKTAGYTTADDMGAATYLIVASGAFVGSPDELGDHTLANGNIAKLIKNIVINVKQYGVIGDGIVDDTAALSAALKNPNVVGNESLNVRTTASVFITNPLQFDMAGMKLLGESTGDVNAWVYIRSSDVDIHNGTFGDGTVDHGKAIVIGDYGDAELFFKNISICNNNFLMAILFTQQAVVSGHGRVFELTISGNRFQSSHDYVDAYPSNNTAVNNIAAIYMQNGTTTLGLDANQSWIIENNRCISFPYFFNNQSVGVTSGVVITKNVISNGMMGIRVYHIYDCIVSENIITDMSDTMHLWQRSTFINNKLVRCGLLTPENRPTFKVEAGTSLNIAGNEIRESLGDGALIDGGNSDFTFGPNNMLYKCGGAGLVVAAPGEYPGQITGLYIKGNRIVECASHGILVKCNGTLRGMTIVSNDIIANGLNNVGDVAGIYLNNPSNFAINDFTIAYNTIRNNDVVGGIQTAKTKWAVKFEQPASTYAEYLITNNVTHTELLVDDNRTGGTGLGSVYDNFTLDITDPQIIGMVWQGNYTRDAIQYSNRRTGLAVIGVLTPAYLGEEVFSTSEQNWYKGIGASLGPWTNADWKVIT